MAAKIRRGLAGQAERGYATGSKTYGYRTVPVLDPSGRLDARGHPALLGKSLVLEESEAQTVRRVFEWYAAGFGVGGIVRRLNQLEPGQWKPGRVRRMLANERYRGRRIWNQRRFERRPGTRQRVARPLPASEWKVYERPDLRIVDDDLWARVQVRREEIRAAVPASGRLRGREGALFSRHLFTGYMRCGECAGAFTTVSGGYGSPRYGCPAAWNSGASVCGNKLTIRAKVVDAALLAGLQAALLEPATIQRITDALAQQLNRVLDQRPAVQESRVASRDVLVRKIKNLVSAVEAGASSPALLQTLTAREADLRGLEAELARLAQISPLRDRLAVMPHWVRQQVAQLAELLRDVPERAKQEFRRLGVSFTFSPVRDEGERPFLRAVGTTEFSTILAGSSGDFTTTVRSHLLSAM